MRERPIEHGCGWVATRSLLRLVAPDLKGRKMVEPRMVALAEVRVYLYELSRRILVDKKNRPRV